MSQSDFSAQPRANEPIVGRDGLVTRAWRDYFARLAMAQSSDDLRQLYEALAARVAELAEGHSLRIVGRNSVSTAGASVVEIQLVGDEAAPGNTEYYGTGPTGQRGFFPIASAIEVDPGELEKSIGPDGIITLGLADVPDEGGGTLQKTAFDAKGRKTGTSEATTTDLSEGTNLYYTDERAAAAAPVQSVNGQTGTPVLGFSDVGAEQASAKLSMLASGTYQPEVSGDNIDFSGSNAAEVSLGVKNTGGGTAVFHYYWKGPASGFPASGVLLGGAGSRPWSGADYADHSTAAYHLIATEAHTATAQGTDFGILATPIGGTQSNRVYAGWFNGEGDFINSLGQSKRKINPLERGRGIEVLRMLGTVLGTAEITMGSNAPTTYQTLFRGYALDGILESMTATWANRGTGFALCGHDGTNLVGAKALVGLLSTDIWNGTSTPARITFETTTPGSTVRTLRWQVSDSGHFLPGSDDAYEIGNSAARPKQLWAVAGTINTSDAREKTPVRPFTAAELAAATELGREIGVYQWLVMVAEKGSGARQHIGMTVQRAIDVMESHGLDPFAYGFICYDEWDELPEIRGEGGEVMQKYRPAGDRYSFRMDELLAFIARGLAQRLDAVEQRLAAAGL